MCGIVGVVQKQTIDNYFPQETCLKGLKRLEYRGYDSAGIALSGFNSENYHQVSSQTQTIPGLKVQVRKKAGRLNRLVEDIEKHPTLPASVAIAHTRWATHGIPSDANAHPHVSNDSRVALIHNGIIENADQIRDELEAEGIFFSSATDTEVAVHLLRKELDNVTVAEGECALSVAMQNVANRFRGTFTLLAIDAYNPEFIVGARHDSPLVVGIGEEQNFLASDVIAFIDYTKNAIAVDNDRIVTISPDQISITDFEGNPQNFESYTVDWDIERASKGGYDTFMEKEILEEPKAVADTLVGRFNDKGDLKLDEIKLEPELFVHRLKNINKIIIVACGTASYAGMVAKYALEHWTQIPVEVELSHEFRYRASVVNEKTLVIGISQSGETMDTIMAIKHAKTLGALTFSICNSFGTSIPRESDAVLYTHAGPEIAVASTKAFVAQITACYLFGLYLAGILGKKYPDEINQIIIELKDMPDKMQDLLDQFPEIWTLAEKLKSATSFFYLGRNVGYPIALEGALKLKEIAYLHAEGFAAGELKHGPIALIDQDQPVFVIVPPLEMDELHSKVLSNIQEIASRGAFVITICDEGDAEAIKYSGFSFQRSKSPVIFTPLLDVLPLQMFAFALATLKGRDVDQPRNLAKSVTVE